MSVLLDHVRPRHRMPRACAIALAHALLAALFVALAIPARAQSDQPTQNAQLDQTPQKKPDQTPQKKSGEKPTLLKGAVQSTKHDPKASMLVNADELVHNYHENLVSAVGHVQIYYEGAVLEADRVTFDRNTNRLHAQGNVRYRTKDGKVLYGEVIELDKDFKEGFANSLLIETPQKTHFAAARADRTNGNTTVFQSGIYTACQACKDDPTKPPLWQVKAQRIIHKEDERIIYYENAVFEIFGQPVLNIPMFWHPDPTVKRQSGFLVPHAFSSSKLGVGVEEPYFWAIAPDKDITFAAVPLTNQGVLGKIEYRQRFLTGAFTVKASGIIQSDPGAFNLSPTSTAINLTGGTAGAGTRTNRGAIESTGQFDINKQWVWGWDGVLTTDRTYLNDYNTLTQEHANEKVSQLYLVGQGDRSYFDMRGMSFLGMSELDRNNEQPVIHPVLDYNYIYGQPVLGGELGFTMNFASLSRQEAEFDAINQAALNSDFCDSRAIVLGKTNPTNCVMRGAPGDYTRGTFQLDWKRTITNSIGMMFTPFVRLRTDAAYANISNANGVTSLFMPTGGDSLVRAMPAIGLETRWPFISVHEWGTQTLEPIAQVIVRPNETQIGKFPNEDSQSLVFSDANLFAIDKYSGFDRVEGGTRANVGVQYTMNINRFGTINAMFGQSYQLAGLNSFSVTDATNIGLESGLDHNVSDYVARLYYQPTNNLSFTTRYLFDRDTFALNRFEAEATTIWDRLKLTTTFASYQAQPLIGFLTRREGIYQTAAYNFDKHWSVTGGIRYDLDLNHTDLYTVGVNYLDECFALMATYTYDDTNFLIQKPDHRFMARINLRTLSSPDTPTGITTLGPTAGTSVMTTPN